MNAPELASVSTFASTAEAQLAKGVLDEAGIDSVIRADNAGGMYPALGGIAEVDLLVMVEDLDAARAALRNAQDSD